MRLRVALALALQLGCAGPIDVLKVASPEEAAQANGTKLHAVAILRDKARAAVPPDTTFSKLEAHVPRPGIFTYSLDPGETVVRDKEQHIVGVQSGSELTKFIAGTASLEGNEVRGELEGHVERVPLLAGDRVELRGNFAPDENVPMGGKVVSTRFWSAFVFGGVLLGGAWIPSIAVAAVSSVEADHWLYVPIVGPWVAYITRASLSCATDPTPCLSDAGERVAILADGIIQTAGALLLAVGLPTFAEVRWGKDARVRFGPSLTIQGVF